ncbi:MAG: MFS transporter [Verrucomicrobia bacterium]|nr:MFS transporter [Verrucomicrobiota bacterium]
MTTVPPTPTSDTPPSLARAWGVVALLCVVAALNYLDRNMLTTMRPSIVAAVPMTNAQFGLLTSIFLWVYGLLSPFAGFLADRFSRSRVIIVSLFVWSVVTWLTAHATTYGELLVARALMGVSEAAYIPAALALISDYHRGSTRSLATGVHMTGIAVGSGLGGLGGWLADRHEWTFAFNFFGLVGIGYSLVLLFALRDAPREQAGTANAAAPVAFGEAAQSLFAQRPFLLALAFFGLLGIAGWGLVGWLPTYFQERFHLTQGAGGLNATAWMSGAGFVGVLLGGAIADRWSRTHPRARILTPAIGLCIAAVGILALATAPALPMAIGGLVVYGLTRNFTDANMMPILCLVADARYRATGYGFLNLVACVIGGVYIYIGGALRDANIGLSIVFLVMTVILVICATLLFLIKPPSSTPTA